MSDLIIQKIIEKGGGWGVILYATLTIVLKKKGNEISTYRMVPPFLIFLSDVASSKFNQ